MSAKERALLLCKHLPLTENKQKKEMETRSYLQEISVCKRGAVQLPAVFLPVTVAMWLDEQEALLWKQLIPVQ